MAGFDEPAIKIVDFSPTVASSCGSRGFRVRPRPQASHWNTRSTMKTEELLSITRGFVACPRVWHLHLGTHKFQSSQPSLATNPASKQMFAPE